MNAYNPDCELCDGTGVSTGYACQMPAHPCPRCTMPRPDPDAAHPAPQGGNLAHPSASPKSLKDNDSEPKDGAISARFGPPSEPAPQGQAEPVAGGESHPFHRDLAGLCEFIDATCTGDPKSMALVQSAWYRCMARNHPANQAAPAPQVVDARDGEDARRFRFEHTNHDAMAKIELRAIQLAPGLPVDWWRAEIDAAMKPEEGA